jgi:hypothetical protein
MIKVFIPSDSAAVALGASRVATEVMRQAQIRGIEIQIIRNSSRGLFFAEPLIEVEIAGQRIAYGPVTIEDLPSLFDANFLHGGDHSLALGPVNQIPFLAKQERLTFLRMGVTQALSLDEYQEHEGFQGLRNALKLLTSNGLANRPSLRPSPSRAYAVAEAQLFPLGLNGIPSERLPRIKNTLFATPTKVTLELTQIA